MTYAIIMEIAATGPIGLIADSHGRLDLVRWALGELTERGASIVVHLGDLCDSLAPLALEDAVDLVEQAGIVTVLGNNEYAVLEAHRNRHPNPLTLRVMAFLESLPYIVTMGEVTFAHSAPFPWPAALRWPVAEGAPPFRSRFAHRCRILFRGHSHTPSILRMENGSWTGVHTGADGVYELEKASTYVITVGALEKGAYALYDPASETVRFLRLKS
ncbi:MAG TPA: metallophosphoesterase family protein [Deltaproteobacteria bacterium]|nr:metallophosphoesterase family protein [Deltaproteobacteria bacterium]HPP79635.1 metallophosphoesterase family protein [Deltaproteobacteria bacterium]